MDMDRMLHDAHLSAADASKENAVLLQIGSFNPPTTAHVRLLIAARETVEEQGIHVRGAYVSPANAYYSKPGLVSAQHRLNMCKLSYTWNWVYVDDWEMRQNRYVRTFEVVERIRTLGVSVFLVCGSDIVQRMSDRSAWPKWSIDRLLAGVQLVVKKRGDGLIADSFGQVLWIERWVGELSSTIVREHAANGWGLDGMVAEAVRKFIGKLYPEPV